MDLGSGSQSMRTETTQKKKAREHALMGTDGESNIEKMLHVFGSTEHQ